MNEQATGVEIRMIGDSTFAQEVTEAGTPVLVDFMADWCPPCKIMDPIFKQLAAEFNGRVKFVKLNTDYNPQTVANLGVFSMPTFMLLSGDRILAQNVGTMKAPALRAWIEAGLAK